MKYICTYTTTLNLTVTLDAADEDDAADQSWQHSQNYLDTVMGDHRTVRAEATLDGIGVDTITEATP